MLGMACPAPPQTNVNADEVSDVRASHQHRSTCSIQSESRPKRRLMRAILVRTRIGKGQCTGPSAANAMAPRHPRAENHSVVRVRLSSPTVARPGRYPSFGAVSMTAPVFGRVPAPAEALVRELQAVTFEDCLLILSELARLFYANERRIDLSAERGAMKAIARQLDKAVTALESLQATQPNRAWSSILEGTRAQAVAARQAAEGIPDGRVAITLRTLSATFVILKSSLGLPKPVLSNTSEDVRQVAALCEAAGLPLSPERIRGALSEACQLLDGPMQREDMSTAALTRMMAAARRFPSGFAAAELVAEGLVKP